MRIGNIGIGNIFTLATLFEDLGKKCFGFTRMDAAEIPHLKSRA